ncbi:MAG: methyltransferase [Rhodobacteraceae bacterium]|nr:MAG: methyltransferase [Paracoccaceae bacterium]
MTGQSPKSVTHSIAHKGEGDRLFAPSAARNLEVLSDLLGDVAPTTGDALELASGTGQHVVSYAARLPGLNWQPSELDPARRASIDAHVADAGLGNIAPAIALNAAQAGWSARHGGKALIILSNLLHLITDKATNTVIQEAARALAPGGRLVIYGPFMRGGELTSDGDASFHAGLIARDPAIGYKDDFDMMDLIQGAGLDMAEVIEMPANNLVLVAQK